MTRAAGIKIKALDLDGDDGAPPNVKIEQSIATVGTKVGVAYVLLPIISHPHERVKLRTL
jgi:hypothetical protein